MIKNVNEALNVMIDFYTEYFNGDCCNPLFNVSKKVIDNFEEAKKFLYDMEKELEEAKKNKRILEVLKNFSQTHKENEDLGIMIEIWSDTEYQDEYQDIKEWVEEVHNHNEKIKKELRRKL